MEPPIQTPIDLNQSRIVLKQDSTLIGMIEMSLSSWLVAGIVPVERQPLKKLAARAGAPATPSGDNDQVPLILWSGGVLATTLISMSRPAGSRPRKLFALESWRWIEEFDTVRLGTLLQVGKIIWVAAERDVVQLFALALPTTPQSWSRPNVLRASALPFARGFLFLTSIHWFCGAKILGQSRLIAGTSLT
jgi:hypothetical protein